MDSLSYNSVLAALSIKENDKIILIKENNLADANFVITHLVKQIFTNINNKICLVTLHHSIKHYITVGKRLGYDLQKKIDQGFVKLVEPLRSIGEDIGTSHMRFINPDKENLTKYLLKHIESEISALQGDDDDEKFDIYLIIDDLSHLLEFGTGINYIFSFINTCINMNKVTTIVNCHVTSKSDGILANNLEYIADVVVEVSPLKTGRSVDVTGVFSVKRPNDNMNIPTIYHYKSFNRGIKTFKPGESLKFL